MAAAHIATVRNTLRNQLKGAAILADHPLDAKIANLLGQRVNRKFELPLLNGYRNQFIGKWCALSVRNERVEQRKTILAPGNTDSYTVCRPKHLEPSHGAAHLVEDFLFRAHWTSLLFTIAERLP